MKKLKTAQCDGYTVRYVVDDKGPWFFVSDLARPAGYARGSKALITKNNVTRLGWAIDSGSSRGAYRTINYLDAVARLTTSRKPEAKLVIDWIENLPWQSNS